MRGAEGNFQLTGVLSEYDTEKLIMILDRFKSLPGPAENVKIRCFTLGLPYNTQLKGTLYSPVRHVRNSNSSYF